MQPTNRAAWLRVWIFASYLVGSGAGCEGPGRQIGLEPLGERPDPSIDEDAGPMLPEGAIPCRRDSDCDDGVECTVDQCLTQGYCSVRIDNSRCSDGITCNGTEACDPRQGGCVPGVIPTCDDQDPCTIDRCDEDAKDCVHDPRDFDRDGEADYHCAGGTDCDDFDPRRGGSAREICNDSIDNDCDETVDETECGAIQHDTCADALDVSAGHTFEQPLSGALGDYATTCDVANEAVHDLVYTFQIDAPSDVKLVAHGLQVDGSEEISNVAVQRECGVVSSEVRCARGVPADLRLRALPAGRYFVLVSSIGASRDVQLDVSFGPPTSPQPNTICENATPVGPAGGHFEGDFIQAGDDIINACTLPGQPDVFYSIHLERESDIEITAFGKESRDNVYVTLRDGCGEGQEGMGHCDMGIRVATRYYQQPAGDYILVLEGKSSPEQGYSLDVKISQPTPPPHGDNCSDPLTIAVGEMQRVTLTNLKDDALSSTCQGAGPDVVFALTVPSPQDLQIEADADGADVAVAMQITCGESRSERQCRSGNPVNTRVHNVGAGAYFLTVGAPPGTDAVSVKVSSLPLTPLTNVTGNDTCYSAQDIPAEGGLFGGDTQLLLADYSSSTCGGGASSKDAAYRLVLTERRRVVASVGADFDAVLMRYAMRNGSSVLCDDPMPAACSDDAGGGASEVLEEILEPGTYYYIVDGFKDFNAGSYLFEVSIRDP